MRRLVERVPDGSRAAFIVDAIEAVLNRAGLHDRK